MQMLACGSYVAPQAGGGGGASADISGRETTTSLAIPDELTGACLGPMRGCGSSTSSTSLSSNPEASKIAGRPTQAEVLSRLVYLAIDLFVRIKLIETTKDS